MSLRLLKNTFHRMRDKADLVNRKNILDLVENDPSANFLDVGCHDGRWSLEVARKVGTGSVHGLDVTHESLEEAGREGVRVCLGNLNGSLPFADGIFDCVHSNQVINTFATRIVLFPK